ncbi:hypothetical protein SCB49_06002 [unidentified eubacterium SCB49]|nr:hypothetical protein SCB49_05892 [unidentified eubacterium SCB49]EDM45336.1 hypothetical protein SCB49_06002 [unidentified eubacterium SCB49]
MLNQLRLTITQKDAIQIKDDQLLPTLTTGLYKIEKYFEDGTIEEVIIFKED